MNKLKPREIAINILNPKIGSSDYVEHRLESLAAEGLSAVDRRLVQELVYGVVRWQATLDWLIARKSANATQKSMIQALLRLGLYQMFWLDRIPNYASVNETVEMAKRLGLGPQAGYVNAVLRGYAREEEATRKSLADLRIEQPSLGYSHPEWLWERWERRFGRENVLRLFEWNNSPPVTYARVNTLRVEAGELVKGWELEQVQSTPQTWSWTGQNLIYRLDSHPPLATLRSFREGHFYIQDPSTLLAVRMLDPQPGERILDVCAAPGGKTCFMAQCMRNHGCVLATDTQPDRLTLVQENCARLGIQCVEVSPWPIPESQPGPRWDKILVDAPCSNTGVMRRRVDLRWRLRVEEFSRLQKAQLEILGRAADVLKPGGVLVYSTCSLEPEENEEVVQQFAARHAEFELERTQQVDPIKDGVDGAFVARFHLGGVVVDH